MSEYIKPSRFEIAEALIALFIAIALQVVVWRVNHRFLADAQYIVIIIELVLGIILGFTTSFKSLHGRALQHAAATTLIGLITLANFTALAFVIYALISGSATNGIELLGSALAIFVTNIIVYAVWYWEIDSPALTNRRWTKSDKDFQFTQQDLAHEFPTWKPQFVDYFYISVINSINGATASAHPLTKQAKLLMATQAMISIFTVALVIARSVSILS
ncbi:MAG: hypothetical protein ACSLEY_01085 [Candidatus Saccharimonadales bacterium]